MSATVRQNSDAPNHLPLTQHSAPSLHVTLNDADHTRALRAPVKVDKDDRASVILEPHWAAAIDVATD